MRVYADGGEVIKHESDVVSIDHLRKHGPSTKFWSGYNWDRKVLEDTWLEEGYIKPADAMYMQMSFGQFHLWPKPDMRKVLSNPKTPFEPYINIDLLTKSQGYHEGWD
jgi:hypothetical protein